MRDAREYYPGLLPNTPNVWTGSAYHWRISSPSARTSTMRQKWSASTSSARGRRAGREIRMLIDRADPFATAKPDARLIKLSIRAHRFNATLAGSGGTPFAALAKPGAPSLQPGC